MRASAIAHPNIALIKYWGKNDVGKNLPAVGSLSVTLGALSTETTVEFDGSLERDELILNGQEQPGELPRLKACLDAMREFSGTSEYARVNSVNDFPTGAGLASSASGYAALVTAAAGALGIASTDEWPEQGIIDITRIGSGSAPRSLFGGIVLLDQQGEDTALTQLSGAEDWVLSAAVAVTTESGKDVSSRDGMERSRDTSPYYAPWIDTHPADLETATKLIEARDFFTLAELAEHNCLKMHAVMMTTRPPLLYWSPVTMACMQTITSLRADGVPVFFTVDAGPQVNAICLPDSLAEVTAALHEVPGVIRIIAGDLGEGARIVTSDD